MNGRGRRAVPTTAPLKNADPDSAAGADAKPTFPDEPYIVALNEHGEKLLEGGTVHLPFRLFHYTTTDAFLKILDSATFWATDYRCTNDISELQYGEQIFAEVIHLARSQKERRQSCKMAQLLDHLCDTFPQNTPSFPTNWDLRCFVICFSEESNLLSQWRAYGGQSGSSSINLGLHAGELSRIIGAKDVSPLNLRLDRVEYNLPRQRELAKQLVNAFLDKAEEWADRELSTSRFIARTTSALLKYALQYIVRFKHSSFSEEKEWRIIGMFQQHEFSSLQSAGLLAHRPSAYGVTAYIQVPIKSQARDTKNKIPLQKVYIGPSGYSQLATEGVRSYLMGKGYDFCDVSASDFPFRSLR
jgi:hypothetical protein